MRRNWPELIAVFILFFVFVQFVNFIFWLAAVSVIYHYDVYLWILGAGAAFFWIAVGWLMRIAFEQEKD